MAKKTQGFSRGVKFLTGIFGQEADKAGGCLMFDKYLKEWINGATFPNEESLSVAYGSWVFHEELVALLEDRFMEIKDFDSSINQFRYEAARACVRAIHPEYPHEFADGTKGSDLITSDDLSDFLKVMSSSSMWNDRKVQDNMATARYIINSLHPSNENKTYEQSFYSEQSIASRSDQEIMMNIDFNSDDLTWTSEFEELEKMQWKKRSPEHLHEHIDALDLTNLKKILRDERDRPFAPKGWQSQFLISMRRFNYIAACRRAGKTMLATYLIIRQLMLPNQKVAILVPTLKNHAKNIWDYLVTFTKLLQFDDEFSIQFKQSSWSCKCKGTNSSITFYSAKDSVAVRGATVNLLIVDEMAFVHEDSFKTASALIRTTRGMIYGISTVNKEMPKNYFYYQLVRAEVEGFSEDSMYFGMRIDLYNNPFISDEDKADIIDEGRSDPETFNAEWMASFSDSSSLKLGKFWIVDESPMFIDLANKVEFAIHSSVSDAIGRSQYSHHIISYDPAKLVDQPGISVISFKDGIGFVTISGYMKGVDYMDQAEVMEYLSKVIFKNKSDIVLDYTGAGVVVEDILRSKGLICNCIQSLGGTFVGQEGRIYKVGVDTLHSAIATKMEMNQLRGYTFQKDMFYELEAYTPDMIRKGGNHFDIVSSIRNSCWYGNLMGYFYIPEVERAERRLMEGNFDGQDMDIDPWGYPMQKDTGYARMEKCRY